MKQRLVYFLDKTSFFSKHQFGFRQGIGTETALLEFVSRIWDGLNDGKRVSGLFLDITKAFDTVNHDILLEKMYRCGIRGVVHKWFSNYLVGRMQCVKVNGAVSQLKEIEFGVPQGSVLGATLFLIYINDLCDATLQGQISSFADDTALCYTGDSWREIQTRMNFDLQSIRWWFAMNNMVLSPDKTKFINFRLRGNINFETKIMYKCLECLCSGAQCNVECVQLTEEETIKYLGIDLDKELNYKIHILNLKKKNYAMPLEYFISCGKCVVMTS